MVHADVPIMGLAVAHLAKDDVRHASGAGNVDLNGFIAGIRSSPVLVTNNPNGGWLNGPAAIQMEGVFHSVKHARAAGPRMRTQIIGGVDYREVVIINPNGASFVLIHVQRVGVASCQAENRGELGVEINGAEIA